MATYIVTYDLNQEGTTRPKIVDEIRSLGSDSIRLSESSYAITTSRSPEAVFRALKDILDDNDQLYVITLRKPHAGRGKREVKTWLESNLS